MPLCITLHGAAKRITLEGLVCHLPDIRYCQQDRIQHESNDKPAKSLDQVGRYTCRGSGQAIERNFAEEISSGNEDDVNNPAEDHGCALTL